MAIQIQLRRGTASQWTAANTLLAQGEIGLETDTSKLKLGDGSTLWNSLSYFSAGSGVTAVTATSPVASSGGLTPVISMPAATTSVSGYLTSTDWTTFNGKGSGTVTSVAATAGTGISVSGSPITTSGTLTITNTAPDQTVALTAGTGISTSGTYPNFTITNSAPDQTVALTGAGTTSITGTYPNFTITSNDSATGTVTSVAATVPSFLSVTGSPITTSGTLAIALASTPTNGQLLIGNGTGFSYANLTAGSNITITNSAGGISIASSGGGSSSPIPKLLSWSIGGF